MRLPALPILPRSLPRPRRLSTRLVITAVALVAVVAVLLAVATTLAMGSYLTGQLDAEVRASLSRAAGAPAPPLAEPRPDAPRHDDGDGDDDEPPDVRGQQVSTLTAYFSADGTSGVGDVIRDRRGGADRQLLDAEALAELADVPRDGQGARGAASTASASTAWPPAAAGSTRSWGCRRARSTTP